MTNLPSHRVFRVTYSSVHHANPGAGENKVSTHNEPHLWQCRDGLAALELYAAMPRERSYATTIMMYPKDDQRNWHEFPRFFPGDWLLLNTRPPISDERTKKAIPRSECVLEKAIFPELKRYFLKCSRKKVELTEHATTCLPEHLRKYWGKVEFAENAKMPVKDADEKFIQIAKNVKGRISEMPQLTGKRGLIQDAPRYEGTEKRKVCTLGIFLRLENIPIPDAAGVTLIACFSWCGLSTLFWSRVVRTRFAHWFHDERIKFAMAEMVFKQPLPHRMLTPEWADDDSLLGVNLLTMTPGLL